ncbi:hypothetical protein PhCBS80983_g06036 [Powellomyces hirtus]|uniref:Bromo domain-containing protein n=1 Tax=Powellomyces hirtus TaxID=109895 RepID=A0A507DSA0_9FUNG|nr:hypothetical protein PhCBS80983_g06036 [Powellomyces hirtus]
MSASCEPLLSRRRNPHSQIWVEIVSKVSTPGPFKSKHAVSQQQPHLQRSPAATSTRISSASTSKRKRVPVGHSAAPTGVSLPHFPSASGKKTAVPANAKRKKVAHCPQDLSLDDPPLGSPSLSDNSSNCQKISGGASGRRISKRSSLSVEIISTSLSVDATPATFNHTLVHHPLFDNEKRQDKPSAIPAMIHFILFCHTLAELLEWFPIHVTFMEEELAKPDSLYIIHLIIKLLRKLGREPHTARLSNWDSALRDQALHRKSAVKWPADVTFAQLDLVVRMQLLSELCEWVLNAVRKDVKGSLLNQTRLLPIALEHVFARRKTFVYWHFPVGAFRQRFYCQVLDFRDGDDVDPVLHLADSLKPCAEFYLVASTAHAWSTFLHKALSSRVPAHQQLQSAFLKLKFEMASEDFDTRKGTGSPMLPPESILQELERDEAKWQREEAEAQEQRKARAEKRRIHADRLRLERKAAQEVGLVSMEDIAPPAANTRSQQAALATVLRNDDGTNSFPRRDSFSSMASGGDNMLDQEAAGEVFAIDTQASEALDGGDTQEQEGEQEEDRIIDRGPTPALQKEEECRIRRAMASQLWALHQDVEKHNFEQKSPATTTNGNHLPQWRRLTNQLEEPRLPEDSPCKPRLWIRNLNGVQYDSDFRSRKMDFLVKNACKHIVDGMKRHPSHEPFFEPVDLTAVEGYLKVVKHPMELKTVYVKLILNNYPNFQTFLDDVLLIFHNCRTFNKPLADIVYQCLQLELRFLELCCQLEIAVGHDGVGLDRVDPFLAFKKKTSVKKSVRTPRQRKPRARKSDLAEQTDTRAPTSKRPAKKKAAANALISLESDIPTGAVALPTWISSTSTRRGMDLFSLSTPSVGSPLEQDSGTMGGGQQHHPFTSHSPVVSNTNMTVETYRAMFAASSGHYSVDTAPISALPPTPMPATAASANSISFLLQDPVQPVAPRLSGVEILRVAQQTAATLLNMNAPTKGDLNSYPAQRMVSPPLLSQHALQPPDQHQHQQPQGEDSQQSCQHERANSFTEPGTAWPPLQIGDWVPPQELAAPGLYDPPSLSPQPTTAAHSNLSSRTVSPKTGFAFSAPLVGHLSLTMQQPDTSVAAALPSWPVPTGALTALKPSMSAPAPAAGHHLSWSSHPPPSQLAGGAAPTPIPSNPDDGSRGGLAASHPGSAVPHHPSFARQNGTGGPYAERRESQECHQQLQRQQQEQQQQLGRITLPPLLSRRSDEERGTYLATSLRNLQQPSQQQQDQQNRQQRNESWGSVHLPSGRNAMDAGTSHGASGFPNGLRLDAPPFELVQPAIQQQQQQKKNQQQQQTYDRSQQQWDAGQGARIQQQQQQLTYLSLGLPNAGDGVRPSHPTPMQQQQEREPQDYGHHRDPHQNNPTFTRPDTNPSYHYPPHQARQQLSSSASATNLTHAFIPPASAIPATTRTNPWSFHVPPDHHHHHHHQQRYP